jgi:integrase
MQDFAKANGNKPSTMDAKERILRLHLLPVLGQASIDAIGDAEVQKVKLALAGKAAKTQACVLAQLGTMLKSAERWNLIARAPHIDLPRVVQTEMEFYDFDEWEQLVTGADKAGPMVLAMVLLGGEAGLRRGELVALEQGDCGSTEIVIRRNEWQGIVGTPKGGKTRRVPMTERLRLAVAMVRHLRGKRLLWQPSGRRVGVPTLQSWLETASRRAGLPESRDIHKLRHTFCSHLAMRGATAKAIQELAGHADIATTMRYMHLSPAHKSDAIKLLEQRGAARGAGVEQKSKPTPG